VVGSVLGLIVGNGPILQFTFGLFLGPIAAEFGWERGTISAALMCYAFLGAEVDLIAFLLSRYLGLKSFGRLYGLLFAMFSVGSGLGPVIMGKVFDASKSYDGALVLFAVSLVIACGCMSLLGPYQYPVAWRSRSAGDAAKRDGSVSDAVGDEVVLAEQP
jgi:cyanate permease